MKQAEEIILSKKYFELSDSEKELVKELASNEEEYESMRWFLQGMNEEFSAQKIEPSRSLREGVMAHLNQKQPAPKGIWLNGVSAFLFPEGKKFYQYPALQIAAVAVLFVSIIVIYNNKPTFENSLAVNENIEPHLEENNERELNEVTTENLDNINDTENENNLKQSSQEQSPNQTISSLKQSNDAVDADEYQEMSVADEVKLLEDLNYRDNSMRSEATQNNEGAGVDALNTNKPVTTGSVDKKNDELKRDDKQKQIGKEKNTGLSKDQKTTSSETRGYINPTAKNESLAEPEIAPAEEEKSEMVTATAGGIYGNTLDDESIKPDSNQESSKKVNLNDTKILKKLIFVVK